MLPSKYIYANFVGGSNVYFATGVLSSSDIDVFGLFLVDAGNTYLFGSRNTNSNSSSGQLNFLVTSDGTKNSAIGYHNTRLTLTENTFTVGEIYFEKKKNQFTVNNANYNIFEKTGATNTFTGTKDMYILALNNAGAVTYGTNSKGKIGELKITDSSTGVLLYDFVAVYKIDTSEYGLYETVNDVFYGNQGTGTPETMYLVDIDSSVGGDGYCVNQNHGIVKKHYYAFNTIAQIKAVPLDGYVFTGWEVNGKIVSIDADYTFNILEYATDTTFKPIFAKISDNPQNNRYQLLGLQYGVGKITSASQQGNLSDLYAFVRNADLKIDALSQSTSTIILDKVPSAYQNDMPVFLYDTKGKAIFCGIIKSIEGNRLTVREPLSICDGDFLLHTNTNVRGVNFTNYSVLYVGYYYLYFLQMGFMSDDHENMPTQFVNGYIKRMMETIRPSKLDTLVCKEGININVTPLATTEASISNLEEYFFQLFNEYGVYVEAKLYENSDPLYPNLGTKHLLELCFTNPKLYDELNISDDNEAIMNTEINIEEAETTILTLFNSSGTTMRGIYAVQTDGTISQITDSNIDPSYLAYDKCKYKLLMSDDKITSLIAQNLSSALYNHKITFEVDITGKLYRFDDFKIGRRINFYHENKVYKSIITASEFSLLENQEGIQKMKITLGNVRTKLTTKLNLGKVKK